MSKLRTGKITGISIGKYPGGTDTVRILKVQVTHVDDVQTVEHVTESGVDSSPAVGDKVLLELVGSGSYKVSQSTGDKITPVSAPGEKEFYSHDATAKKARLKLNIDGSIGIKNEAESLDYEGTMTALVDAIKNIATFGSPASHVLTASSKTALDDALVDVLKIFKGI